MQHKTTDPSSVAPATEEPLGVTDTAPGTAGRLPSFLDEIASGMQAAVERERERIAAETTNSLDDHVERIRERASTEADELKRLAEEDVRQIREAAVAESERLSRETENRIAERREDLDRHLRQHAALVEREISGTRTAVEAFQTELVRFVARLSDERDPTEIAQLARSLPEPPSVEEIASAARAEAIAELSRTEAATEAATPDVGLVGVMDPGVLRQPAGEAPVDSTPAQLGDVAPAAAEVDDERQTLTPRTRRWADRVLLIAVVLLLAVLVAALVGAVATGQFQAGSGGSVARVM